MEPETSYQQIIYLVYPHQLFMTETIPELNQIPKSFKKNVKFLIMEHPIFFGDREKQYNFNQLKLVLHRASLQYYQNYLKQAGYQTQYFEYHQLKKSNQYLKKFPIKIPKDTQVRFCDPTDHLLAKQLTKLIKATKDRSIQFQMYQTPNFLTTTTQLEQFLKGKSKTTKIYHHQFYAWQKKQLQILQNTQSQDKYNRQPMPDSEVAKIPDLPKSDQTTHWVKEAQQYVKKHWKNNYGNLENMIYPVTHQTSQAWFKHFLQHRFQHFGKYQDAMIQDEPWVYHSVITPMLNIGLLDPQWIVNQVKQYYQQHKTQVKLNNYEGYLRQVIGWREYSRMLYLYRYPEIKKSNYFKNTGKLTQDWYQGTTNIQPIDHTIKMAFKWGYLHHIFRLMMISNFMNLVRLHPDQVYQWFMEFSVDSYDWVMTNNVYSMGLYADGGLTMTRPYLSSSNYILKMSNFKKDPSWTKIWDNLYYYFLADNYQALRKTQMVRNLGIWDRKTPKEKQQIKQQAKQILKKLTK